jgi:DNA-binding protein YbaB
VEDKCLWKRVVSGGSATVLFSTIGEVSQVKPSLLDEVEVEMLQEGLVGATMIGL